VKHILLVANGTIALQIAYNLLDIKGEAITTPFSFVATTSSQVWQGINPIFVDINKDTFNIDYKKIEEKISKTTSAIIPVHVFGNVCDVEKIDEIAKKFNLKVIYDAAHAFGVKYKGNSVLSYGDISTLSFHATKVFHTIEGGALVINNDEIYDKAR
ncbi:DegT/DnrJ/EryC1/StrS family aminotransferase, partial [Clostridium perfringens]|nr:DegT/DnrJ/EryC1/StrS family aminotransferase [Clostridium perfringens]